jgi:hypothetical protein
MTTEPSDLHDRPDALELIASAREFLTTEINAAAEDRLRYLTRVAANALAIAERQLRMQPDQLVGHAERLTNLGVVSNAELAEAIRGGSLSADWGTTLEMVFTDVVEKVRVVNPGYLAEADR